MLWSYHHGRKCWIVLWENVNILDLPPADESEEGGRNKGVSVKCQLSRTVPCNHILFFKKQNHLVPKRKCINLKTKTSVESVTSISIRPLGHGTPSVLDHLSIRFAHLHTMLSIPNQSMLLLDWGILASRKLLLAVIALIMQNNDICCNDISPFCSWRL